MAQSAEQVRYFHYKPEFGQNPYTGFMSFQHFRNEALYSDMVVLPERNMTETEHYECYPVPDYVEENGRDEGYYPDTSMVYIRILWKEFEPIRGQYNYGVIEELIKKARSHRQTMIFRLLPHSTRACDDVPDWLKEIIPCPERPDGKRVKDSPTDPLFIRLYGNAIKMIAERFDREPIFEAMDISLPGAWGEGHKLELYPEEDLLWLYNVYRENFRSTRLIGQISKPELLRYVKEKCEVGMRADGLGQPYLLNEVYPEKIAALSDLWKQAPVSFESYWWLGEWKRQGWDIDEIIERTLQWHISSFNGKSFPVPPEWKDKIDYWVSKMGYHFQPEYVKLPVKVSAGDEAELCIAIDNVGVAPIYTKMPFVVRFVNADAVYTFDTDIDITKWLPGKSFEQVKLTVPDDIQSGEYEVEIGIASPDDLPVYFCTDAPRNGSFYKVGIITVM